MITLAESPQIDNLALVTTLVIIDPNVTNPQQLAAGVIPGAEVKILDAQRDGIIQISEILRAYPNLYSLHLVSHGSPGCIHLGNSKLNLDTLPLYAAKIENWFSSSAPLSEGVSFRAASPAPPLLCSSAPLLLIYGCNVAQGENGQKFLNKLQQITQAQIQASSTKVGNAELGGNWQLDIAVGNNSEPDNTEIIFNQATQRGYSGILVAPVANDDPIPYPPAIELSSLDGSNGFVLNGIDDSDFSGNSVSNAGDINGDGTDDLIIGAYGGFNNIAAGESYVVFGDSDVGSSGTIELSALDGSNGFVLNGIDAGDGLGRSVSNAGDVNGDGIADLIIGAFRADPNSDDEGQSYVVFGGSDVGSSGTIELSALDGSNGFVLNGIDVDDYSGHSVSNAGDINGDGTDDLIIGAYRADPNGSQSGESYVVFGGSDVGSSGTIELSVLDGSNGFVLNGIGLIGGENSGRSVSNAGDINGDGTDDLIIGAPFVIDEGESYVVFGGSDVGSSGIIELSALDGSNGFILNGIDDSDLSGNSVSNAGDINGDGTDDLIIGALLADPVSDNEGESYVVFGGTDVGSSGTIELSSLDGSNGFVLNGIDEDDRLGNSVSNAGDINGDGTDDLIIGAYRAEPNGNFSGESYVVFGRDFNTDEDTPFTTSSVLFNDTDADGDTLSVTAIDTTGTMGIVTNNGDGTFNYDPNGQFDFLKPGETATDTFDYTVTAGGETDTATVTITITGVEDFPIANDDPTIYPAEIELSALNGSNGFVLNGIAAGDQSGFSVSSAVDVNGDGLADLIIGANKANSYAGESYVVFGSSNPSSAIELSALDGSNGFVLNGIAANDQSGISVSNAGDLNGDGLADLIIGAFRANGYTGESYVVFGSGNPSSAIELSALDGSNGFILNGIAAGDRSGRSVSSAGDLNGDGLADLIIGAYGANSYAGQSYVVFGSSNPSSSIDLSALDGSNGFVLNGIAAGDYSGTTVSSAGDLNGDGLADLIIGADRANSGAGESYVVFGSSNPSSAIELSALDGSNGFVLNGIDANDRSGTTVSSAGDLNGDGLADLIIGADRANSNTGESYVVFGSSNPSSAIELSALDGSNGFVLNGIAANDFSGNSVSSAGDLNGDGLADLIIGARGANSNAGESYVVFGSSNPSSAIELSALDGSNGFVLNGIAANDYSGVSVSSAVDVNGDGTTDLIIGASGANSNAGESYVVFGRDFNTDEDTSVNTSSVLFNDTDAEGDTLTITSIDTSSTHW
ncbi:MAG: DUF4347 domain-containing protein [Cyanobacteria bacterium P01_F01_bin.143]